MRLRPLGKTGISIAPVAFGAGPVPAVMTSGSSELAQRLVARAIARGVRWFDTAAGYGEGKSELSLGNALASIQPNEPIYVASKVRVNAVADVDFRPIVLTSVQESLARLQIPRLTLLQIHNSITRSRGDQPTSITPEDVLGPRGILAGMEEARSRGLVEYLGLTGIGDASALREVMRSEKFATIQAPFHLLNPSALVETPIEQHDPNYGQFLQTARELGMGIFAIRVFAAGALVGAPPSAHTLKTPFFPLALYQRDQARANCLAESLGSMAAVREAALRFVLMQPAITSAILGWSEPEHIDDAIRIAQTVP